jgi:hypothetical protein
MVIPANKCQLLMIFLIAEFLISDATIHHIRIPQSYNQALNKGSIVFKLNNVTITVIFYPRRYTKLSFHKKQSFQLYII